MYAIDDRILVIGLPTLAREIGANVTEAIWVTQAYVLAATISLLLIGRLADVAGRVKLYNIGFIIFTIGSGLAAISFTPAELIASRLVQGLGASAIAANGLAILTDATPENELGTFIGYNQVAFRSGTVMGLVLSGVLLSITSWRALFYINIPIGIFGTLWAHYRLKEVSKINRANISRKIDWQGFATVTSGLTLVLLAITFFSYGSSDYSVSSVILGLGAVLLIAFMFIERRKVVPLLDLKLLKIRVVGGGMVAAMLSAITWNGMLYMISIYMQVVLGFTPLQAGLGVLPLEGCLLFVGPLAGRISDRWKSPLFPTIGLLFFAISCFYEAILFNVSTTYLVVAFALVLVALGQGIFTSPNLRIIMSSVPAGNRGVTNSFRQTLYNIGDTTGPVLSITLITLGIPYHVFTSLLQSTIGTGLALEVARQEFVSGYKLTALVLGVVSLVAIVPSSLRSRKKDSSNLEKLDS